MPLPPRPELEALAVRAGRIALEHFCRVTAETKADRSLVTPADREVEAFLATELGRLLPDAGVLGEEGTARPRSGPYQIVIDPIDGTSSFVSGLPTWCICVGVLQESEPVAGVVHLPCTGETYSAIGGRAWWNGVALATLDARRERLERFIVADGKSHLRRGFTYRGKVRSFGSAAYHVVLAARGAAEAALLDHAHVWDLVAPGAILRAVGGSYQYLTGEPVDLALLIDGRPAPRAVLAGAAETIADLRLSLGVLEESSGSA